MSFHLIEYKTQRGECIEVYNKVYILYMYFYYIYSLFIILLLLYTIHYCTTFLFSAKRHTNTQNDKMTFDILTLVF